MPVRETKISDREGLESVRCALCNSDDAQLLFSKKDKFLISEADFKVVQCKRCGLIYVNPRPPESEIANFYPETYSWKETLRADSFITRFLRTLEKTYRYHLLRYEVNKVLRNTGLTKAKVLDIGCGAGDRLKIFKEKGFDTYGVDISTSAIYAKETLGLNVINSDLASARYPDDYFDAVTMYNVLEHLHKPVEMLKEAQRILKKGGFLVIQVPNTDSLQFKRFGKRWAAFDVPRDLYYFNPGLLSGLLKKAGFAVIKTDHMSGFLHPPTIVISMFPGLDPQKSWLAENKSKSTALKRAGWAFWTLVLSPVAFMESLVKKSAIITLVADKV